MSALNSHSKLRGNPDHVQAIFNPRRIENKAIAASCLGEWRDLLVGGVDSECRNEVSHGDAGVLLPLLEVLGIVNEDEEIVLLALEVDLGLSSFSASHDC